MNGFISSTTFRSYFVTLLPEEEINKYIDQLGGIIATSIGKEYFWWKNKEGESISFTHKSKLGSFDRSLLSIKKEKAESAFNMILEIKSPSIFN